MAPEQAPFCHTLEQWYVVMCRGAFHRSLLLLLLLQGMRHFFCVSSYSCGNNDCGVVLMVVG